MSTWKVQFGQLLEEQMMATAATRKMTMSDLMMLYIKRGILIDACGKMMESITFHPNGTTHIEKSTVDWG